MARRLLSLAGMWRDLRQAAVSLWRSPLFTISAVAALGLAIGANATIFGLIDGLWFRPPGVENPARLVWIYSTTADERQGSWSYPEYEALRDRTTSFTGVVARGRRGTTLKSADGTPELLLVNVVSPNFFSALGVTAQYGRVFAPGEDQQPVVVLGHAFWRRRFGGDPSVVGRTLLLARGQTVPAVVAGVLPETFRDLDAGTDRDIWMPPQVWMRLEDRAAFTRRTDRWFEVLAVRSPKVASARRAQPDVAAVADQLALALPDTNTGRSARVVSHFDRRMEDAGTNAFVLLGLVLLVVAITCVNVANLLLARGAARARELGVRSALGATRWRLVRELFVESAILGCAGALTGITLSLWLIRLIPLLLVAPPGFRSFAVFQADGRVLAFTLAVTAVTTILFGVAPSWLAARADVAPLLKSGAPGSGQARLDGTVGRVLAVAQVAVSLVLLTTAAALVRSFSEIARADVGLSSPQVLTAWSAAADVIPSQMPQTRTALDRLAALPGVTRTAVAFRAPLSLSGGGAAKAVYFPERPQAPGTAPPAVKFNAVSRDYFSVLGTRLIAGRFFDASDEQPGEPVVIVNQEFAARFYPGGSALGARVGFDAAASPGHRIVGIVQNAAINSIAEAPEPYVYLPYWRAAYGEATFLIQSARDAGALVPAVREALRSVDPALEARRVVTMREYVDYSSSGYRATAALGAGLGAIGLALTVLGVYGVIAYRATRRVREIGIRIALGASTSQVLSLIIREGVVVALMGIAIGIPSAYVATRLIASFLFRVGPWDPAAFAGSAALLFVSICAAAAIPAWRAAQVRPAETLKSS